MQGRPLGLVLKGLLCCGLLVQLSHIQAENNISTVDKVFMTAGTVSAIAGAACGYMLTRNMTVATSGGLIAASAVKGLYNVRYYNQVLSQCELDYGFVPYVHWLQYPAQFGQDVLCLESPALDMTDRDDHSLCLVEVQKKINVFDTVDAHVIWNFEKFKDILPHTNFESAYCISKCYMASFGYETLGILKSAISYQIAKIEYDFDTLIHLTDLSWSRVKMPKTLDEHNELKLNLLACTHYYGIYTWLGVCGYSPVHNGQRAKDCLVALSKIHIFLINFQELLKTCIDDDVTLLIHEQGMLHFSLQHIHYVQKKL